MAASTLFDTKVRHSAADSCTQTEHVAEFSYVESETLLAELVSTALIKL